MPLILGDKPIMPIYEYVCTDCDHELEVLQKMGDLPLEKCPACGLNTLKKQISAAAFHLKGTGWYETDFKGKKKTGETEKSNKEKTDKSSESTTSTDKSTESKSTSKTETSSTSTGNS
jgi:putative FmdB family regulatory protein